MEADRPSRCSAWIAAYALGIAHTNRDEDACVRELLTAADGSVGLLRDAERRLRAVPVVDQELRSRASTLLAATVTVAELDDGRHHTAGIASAM